MKVAVLVAGRGSNLQALMEAKQRGTLSVDFVGVASDQPDCQAVQKAAAAGIPIRSFVVKDYENRQQQERAMMIWLQEQGAELLVLAGYMKVLGAEFITEIGMPIINIHPSLLPAFKGLHAQRQAVEYGVRVSGCTVHFVDDGLDSGPIILQDTVPVYTDDTEESLAARILEVEHRLLPEAVSLLAEHKVERQGRQVRILKLDADRSCYNR